MEKELRYSTITGNENDMVIEGYAIVFNQRTLLYEVEGIKYYEVIERNALNTTDLKDICLKYNHGDNAKILARTRNNTLEINVDDKGLFIRAKLADTTDGKDLYSLIKRGDLDKMSFAFTVDDETFDRSDNTRHIRSIKKVFEVSVVDTPAYEGTSIIAKRCKEELTKEARAYIRNELIEELRGTRFDYDDYLERCSIQDLRETIKEVERRRALDEQVKKLNGGKNPFDILKRCISGATFEIKDSINNKRKRGNDMNNIENRSFATDLLEKRSALVSSEILVPKVYHENIQTKFNDVSGILELIKYMPMNGGNTLKIPYVKSTSIGNITDEGAEYGETPTEFGSVDIDAIKLTAYMEYSEEVENLPQAQYEAYIIEELSKIIERKMVQQIAKGTGPKQFKGLYDLTVADNSSDLEITEIDHTTLNKIVYNHNIEAEEVEANNILFLNKKDLGAFANVLIDGKPVYNITFSDNGMTGHINGTKFCICNSLNSLSEVTTGNYSMVYLDPTKYMVAIFGEINLKKDYSTGFRNGIIGVKASMFAGGSLVSPFGISRVKKA